jgi:phosphoribosylaminoimidazolecarboxamide formyltransferase/IMP cyclohydrolase
MRRALLSTSDKSGLLALARGLVARRFEIVSTGGTAKILEKAGLAVTPVSKVTGFPEMMDGRVKTLHPAVHGGILARRQRPDDLAAIARHGIEPIDVVVVNLYPFEEAARRPNVGFDELIEEIDIGGPSLVRAAAKNFRDVLVVVDPEDYGAVLEELDRKGGPSLSFRYGLATKAFSHTAAYDSMIWATLEEFQASGGGELVRAAGGDEAPEALSLELEKSRDLRYGENPHQRAALFNCELEVLQGKELSYTNLLDLDAAERIVREFQEPAAVVIKHANPCGVATGSGPADAYTRARDADTLSAFGGIAGLNRPLDQACARVLVSTFIEGVIAPAVDEEARAVLASRPNMRVVRYRSTGASIRGAGGLEGMELRSALGGVLLQAPDAVTEAHEAWPAGGFPKVVTRRSPSRDEWVALRFAWRVCAHVKSNAVVFTAADRTLAIGAGQMSRVDAVKVAVLKAGAPLNGSVAASDAFFPFRDGLDAIADAGATAIVQPGGSVRDAEVIAAADERAVAMVFTGRRHFRH